MQTRISAASATSLLALAPPVEVRAIALGPAPRRLPHLAFVLTLLLPLCLRAQDPRMRVPSDLQVTCAEDQILRDAGGGVWSCQDDRGSLVNLNQMQISSCSAGEILCWDGIEWECCGRDAPNPTDFSADPAVIAFYTFDNPANRLENTANPGTHDLSDDTTNCDGVTFSSSSPINNMLPTSNTYAVFATDGPNGCGQLTALDSPPLDPAGASNGFSFGCWLRSHVANIVGGAQFIFHKGTNNGGAGWLLRASFAEQVSGEVESEDIFGGDVGDESWHHAVTTYAGDDPASPANAVIQLFVDGTLTATGFVADGEFTPVAKHLHLGASQAHVGQWDGDIDNCFLLDRELSPAEACGIANFGFRGDAAVSRRLCE